MLKKIEVHSKDTLTKVWKVYTFVYNIIYNSYKLETTQMSVSNIVPPLKGVLYSTFSL